MRGFWNLAFPLVLAACGGTLGDASTGKADAGVDARVGSGADSGAETGGDSGCAPCVLSSSTLGACCLQ